MFFKTKAYIQFLFKSKNQHGVHSPFVYDLVTNCFYDKNKKDSYDSIKSISRKHKTSFPFKLKTAKLLYRLPSYLGYKNVLILDGKDLGIATSVLSIDPSIAVTNTPEPKEIYDMIYLDLNGYNKKLIETLFSKTHNDGLVLLGNIHQTKSNHLLWKQIKSDASIHVTIDTFSFGFIFFRKEQAREHFIIRA